MKESASWARRQFRDGLRLNGARIALRQVTRLPGPNPYPNPPRLAGVVVNGAHEAGNGILRLRGAEMAGRFMLGDIIMFPGEVALFTGTESNTEGDNTISIPLVQPLPSALADGAPVQKIFWVADHRVRATISLFPDRLQDGTLILSTDLAVVVSAIDVPDKPTPQQRIVTRAIDGMSDETMTIIGAVPFSTNLTVVGWTIQARST